MHSSTRGCGGAYEGLGGASSNSQVPSSKLSTAIGRAGCSSYTLLWVGTGVPTYNA